MLTDDLRINVQKAKKMLSEKAFVYNIFDTWNKLPEEGVSAGSIYCFKNRLDKPWSKEKIKYDHTATFNSHNPMS